MKKGYVYIILATFIFSTMEIAGKIIENTNPIQLNFIRFLIGGLILLPYSLKYLRKKSIKITRKNIRYFFLIGIVGIVISMCFFQLAIVYTKASTVAILFSTNPIFAIPFVYFILKERITRSSIISMVISIIGIVFILNPIGMSFTRTDIKGIALVLLSAITFALYGVLIKIKVKKFGAIVLNCFAFLCGDFIMLIWILISRFSCFNKYSTGELGSIFFNIPIIREIGKNNIIVLIYLGIVVTGLGYLFYFVAMEKTSVITASLVFFIKPALAPILAFVILKEKIPMNSICGIVFILIGSFIMLKGKRAIMKKNLKKSLKQRKRNC